MIAHSRKPIRQMSNDPLHGLTLKAILQALVDKHGWERLGQLIAIRCFQHEPSLDSSLKFLRKTPWAREKVEALYLRDIAGKH
ncbi:MULTISPECIES: VF530 family protein [unclassified Pseudomonas]|uniref:VF530 family protein n=1 Tax=unclassified Pseudomonas TaxID=196821 RepID=UPI00244D41E4|nr:MULTISPECIES: VF530 family protein [unclassified Pseudomonas]MDH0893855.1 VF530 family protein [Pseudomonas sp. GD03875]MDH1064374.1 VF530 family protein [Pseudomonas sp. GD03985]